MGRVWFQTARSVSERPITHHRGCEIECYRRLNCVKMCAAAIGGFWKMFGVVKSRMCTNKWQNDGSGNKMRVRRCRSVDGRKKGVNHMLRPWKTLEIQPKRKLRVDTYVVPYVWWNTVINAGIFVGLKNVSVPPAGPEVYGWSSFYWGALLIFFIYLFNFLKFTFIAIFLKRRGLKP